MKFQALILTFILLSFIKGEEKDLNLDSFEELNKVEMVVKNQSFLINTTKASKAYFDNLDRNTAVYIMKDEDEFLNETDQRITGQFIDIEPNTIYYIRVYLISSISPSMSNLKKYVYPKDISNKNIIVKENELNFLFFEKDKIYTLDFKENTISKRMIKLSRKPLDSNIIINDNKKLNNESLYYELEKDFKGGLKLEIKEKDAFIEFLSSEEDFDLLKNISL